mgnify:CR=1 FL=1
MSCQTANPLPPTNTIYKCPSCNSSDHLQEAAFRIYCARCGWDTTLLPVKSGDCLHKWEKVGETDEVVWLVGAPPPLKFRLTHYICQICGVGKETESCMGYATMKEFRRGGGER